MTGILKHLLLFSLSKYDRPIRYLLPKLNHPFQTDSIDILTSKLPVYCLPYIKAFIQCLLSFLCSVAVSLVPPLLIRSGIYVTTLCAVVPMNTLLAAVAVCSHTLGWCLVDAWLTLGWRSVDARLMLGWCSVDARMMLGWRSVDARLTLGWCVQYIETSTVYEPHSSALALWMYIYSNTTKLWNGVRLISTQDCH